jgi:hypothetical protein
MSKAIERAASPRVIAAPTAARSPNPPRGDARDGGIPDLRDRLRLASSG